MPAGLLVFIATFLATGGDMLATVLSIAVMFAIVWALRAFLKAHP